MAARLMKELKTLQNEGKNEEIVLYPANDNSIFDWVGFIRGPPDTPYSDGTFELSIKVPVRKLLLPHIYFFRYLLYFI